MKGWTNPARDIGRMAVGNSHSLITVLNYHKKERKWKKCKKNKERKKESVSNKRGQRITLEFRPRTKKKKKTRTESKQERKAEN